MWRACLLLFVIGCDSGPSCEAVWDHIIEICPPELRSMFTPRRDAEIATCKEKLSASQRKCVMAAKDIDELEKCGAM